MLFCISSLLGCCSFRGTFAHLGVTQRSALRSDLTRRGIRGRVLGSETSIPRDAYSSDLQHSEDPRPQIRLDVDLGASHQSLQIQQHQIRRGAQGFTNACM